ncbi:YhdP family protein [Pseudothauera lacus]|uniref:TIGR02099 family protein n=1 Tax=Pseudothauera lacus TaxID=2136175 RepID=A0A2T4IB74_9RHOO|nr:YhdP family protein [Pseudothauera lacus]PTD95019.1 TIGR02099 family protein [Pseudothauera lacus]
MTDTASAPPAVRSARRANRRDALLMVAVVAYFCAAGLFLVLREVVMPRIGEYRPQIAAALGKAIGLPLEIEQISADWSGLRPRFHLGGLTVSERDGSAALRFERVDATLAWSSLLRLRPHFHRLEILAPQLAVRRDAAGRFFVAGMPVDPAAPGGDTLDWLLAQREIVIRDAAVTWSDDLRGAPELRLEELAFRLDRKGGRYRFGLSAQPPAALASRLDLRGDLVSVRPGSRGEWVGQLFIGLDHAELGAWTAWLDYPVELSGSGGLRAWIGVDGEREARLSANLALDGVSTRLGEGLPVLELATLRGHLTVLRSPGGTTVQTRGLALQTGDGVVLEPVDVDLTVRGTVEAPSGGAFRVNRLDFAALARLAAHLPLAPAVRERLAAFDPRGHASAVRLEWQGPPEQLQRWTLAAAFDNIGLAAQGALPGIGGLSGEVDGNERSGRFRIAGRDTWLDLPAVFAEPRLVLSVLQAEGGWTQRDGRLELALDNASFENPDASGSASGRYWPKAGEAGEIDLSARLLRADGPAVWRYMPLVVNQDTRTWLRRSIVGGSAPEARLRLRGDLERFPFRDGADGQFLVTARIAGARLEYAEGWPAIEGIDGELRFEGASMTVTAERGRVFGVRLSGVRADLPDLEAAGGEVMSIRGRAGGPTADFLRFIANSPVRKRVDGLTDAMRAEGTGTLDLALVMPLRHVVDTTVEGSYRFGDNRLWLLPGMPALEGAAGTLRFTGSTLEIPQASGRLFGQPLRLTATTGAEGAVRFEARGGLSVAALQRDFDWPLLAHLSGTTAWQADIDLRRDGSTVSIRSALDGIAASLPEPFNKSARQSWPLLIGFDSRERGERQLIRAELGDRLTLSVERRATPLGWAVARGGLGINTALRSAADGVMISAHVDELDLDAWRRALRGNGGGGQEMPALALAGIELKAGRLQVYGQRLNMVDLSAAAVGGDWRGQLDSREASGRFDWRGAGDGALHARLRHLRLGLGGGGDAEGAEDDALRRLPAVDLVVDDFVLRDKELGRLQVLARNRNRQWELETLALANADGELQGSGVWRGGARPLTRLDFSIRSDNVGALLGRLGYADALRDGKAELSGEVDWQGSPLKVDYHSLDGKLVLSVEDGQFKRLEPGVGRLLGVLSLQALPRRISLDFRDVFSEGFVFDRINGNIAIDDGVMRTEDFSIRGPAARIALRGSVDLEAETQDLRVTVQPTLSESIAIGAAAGLINPVAGVVTYIAQKALSDPFEKLLAFDYAITGSWSEPRVDKLTGARPAPAADPAVPPTEAGSAPQ